MTNDSDPQLQAGTSVKSPPSNTSADTRQADRSELVQKAKVFLDSLQVRNEDLAAKRRFLIEKGLNAQEIDTLLQETIAQPLLIPPRTYPQPPPSNLPNLLIGFFRILSWLAGGSAVFLLLYFRYIFPRLTQSFQARLSLHSQQRDLLQKLTSSLADLKASQTKAFADLPRPQLHQEDVQYKDCHSLDAVFNLTEEVQNIPPITLLRCAIKELALKSEAVTADAIFSALETRWTWLQTEEGSDFAAKLWDTLTTVPLFAQEEKDGVRIWSYTPPTAPTSPPVLISLSELRSALPPVPSPHNRFQHTLQALSDFTGYIAAQTYAVPPTFRLPGIGVGASLPPVEEEVRREIRALKGLVLNRRSFMPSTSRPTNDAVTA